MGTAVQVTITGTATDGCTGPLRAHPAKLATVALHRMHDKQENTTFVPPVWNPTFALRGEGTTRRIGRRHAYEAYD